MSADMKELAKEIVTQLQQEEHSRLWITREDHAVQHSWIATQILKEASKEARKKEIQNRVVGGVTIAAILSICSLVGKAVINWAVTHLTIH